MKTLTLLSALILTSSALAVCTKKPDPKRAVIFVDTNNGPLEIKAAREAACLRGDSFVVIPDGESCKTDCRSDLSEKLKELKTKGAAPVSLIISGHDGGGDYSGTKGSLSRTEITSLFNEEFPEFKNTMESLYLLGCYTGVKFEVFSWMAGFPQLKFIAGYEGSAPASDKLAGHSYVQQLMLKEKQITSRKTQAAITADIESVPGMSVLTSGISVLQNQCIDPETNKPKEFYYRSKPEEGAKMEILNSKDCVEKVAQVRKKTAEFSKYFEGELPVPADTAGGALRQLYNFIRSSEHCYKDQYDIPSGDQVLGMLFYPGYSSNIARFLDEEARKLLDDVKAMTLEEWIAAIAADKAYLEAERDKIAAEMAIAEKDPKAYIAKAEARIKSINQKMSEIAQTAEGRQIEAYMRRTNTSSFEELPTPPFAEKRIQELAGMMKQLEESYVITESEPESLTESFKTRIESYNNKINEIEKSSKTQADLDQLKQRLWAPTKTAVTGGTRKDHGSGLHQLYEFSETVIGLKPEVRQRARALKKNSDTLLVRLKCLPLSWHEANNKPLEAPSCPMAIPSRQSTAPYVDSDSSVYMDMFAEESDGTEETENEDE